MSTTARQAFIAVQQAVGSDPDGIPGARTDSLYAALRSAALNSPDSIWPPEAQPSPPVAASQNSGNTAQGGASPKTVVIATIEGHDITFDGSMVLYTAKAAIDDDGSGPSEGDPDYQNATSLKVNGVSLDATKEAYIVVPPAILDGVPGIVLGCQAKVFYHQKNVRAVVADIGPHQKLGEISIACAEALGIPSSPLIGGVDSGVTYMLWPGVPAEANGRTYPLQKS